MMDAVTRQKAHEARRLHPRIKKAPGPMLPAGEAECPTFILWTDAVRPRPIAKIAEAARINIKDPWPFTCHRSMAEVMRDESLTDDGR